MASKSVSTIALLLSLNILFITMVSSTSAPCPPTAPKTPSTPKVPSPKTPKSPTGYPSCPRDTLKLGVCANVLLADLLHLELGSLPKSQKAQCCPLIAGLVDLEAAVCLCTTVKAKLLSLNLNIPIDLTLLLNYCGKKVPRDFVCA